MVPPENPPPQAELPPPGPFGAAPYAPAGRNGVERWLPVVKAAGGKARKLRELLASAPRMTCFVFLPTLLLALAAGAAPVLGFFLRAEDGSARWQAALPGLLLVAALWYYLSIAAYQWYLARRRRRPRAPWQAPPHIPARREEACLRIPASKEAPLKPWNGACEKRMLGSRKVFTRAWEQAFEFRRIGIVLAGGGAKGVYQAGALQAIHDFLRERQALDAVVSLASTSIGSWNNLFWLAGLLRSVPGQPSLLERWWKEYQLADLVRPKCRSVPGLTTALLSPDPWGDEFDRLFGDCAAPGFAGLVRSLAAEGPSPLHFYLTRTNVLSGRLCFDTNNWRAVSNDKPTHDIDLGRRVCAPEALKRGVLASMSIPPLFGYARIADTQKVDWAEDGGVVDNLPIRLATAFDHCDLLFVLPLNSSFYVGERPPTLAHRLFRVLDVRQGVLERNALKNIYLFNTRYALTKQRNPVPAFVICPQQPLAIGTTELWRSRDLRRAVFDQMYEATWQALQGFFSPERLESFFSAYAKKAEGGSLGRDGYVELLGVDPHWVPGNELHRDTRF